MTNSSILTINHPLLLHTRTNYTVNSMGIDDATIFLKQFKTKYFTTVCDLKDNLYEWYVCVCACMSAFEK